MKLFKKNEAEVIEDVAMEVVDGVQEEVEETKEKIGTKKLVGIVVGGLAVAGAIGAALFKKGSKSNDYTDVSGPYDPEAMDAETVPVADESDFSES